MSHVSYWYDVVRYDTTGGRVWACASWFPYYDGGIGRVWVRANLDGQSLLAYVEAGAVVFGYPPLPSVTLSDYSPSYRTAAYFVGSFDARQPISAKVEISELDYERVKVNFVVEQGGVAKRGWVLRVRDPSGVDTLVGMLEDGTMLFLIPTSDFELMKRECRVVAESVRLNPPAIFAEVYAPSGSAPEYIVSVVYLGEGAPVLAVDVGGTTYNFVHTGDALYGLVVGIAGRDFSPNRVVTVSGYPEADVTLIAGMSHPYAPPPLRIPLERRVVEAPPPPPPSVWQPPSGWGTPVFVAPATIAGGSSASAIIIHSAVEVFERPSVVDGAVRGDISPEVLELSDASGLVRPAGDGASLSDLVVCGRGVRESGVFTDFLRETGKAVVVGDVAQGVDGVRTPRRLFLLADSVVGVDAPASGRLSQDSLYSTESYDFLFKALGALDVATFGERTPTTATFKSTDRLSEADTTTLTAFYPASDVIGFEDVAGRLVVASDGIMFGERGGGTRSLRESLKLRDGFAAQLEKKVSEGLMVAELILKRFGESYIAEVVRWLDEAALGYGVDDGVETAPSLIILAKLEKGLEFLALKDTEAVTLKSPTALVDFLRGRERLSSGFFRVRGDTITFTDGATYGKEAFDVGSWRDALRLSMRVRDRLKALTAVGRLQRATERIKFVVVAAGGSPSADNLILRDGSSIIAKAGDRLKLQCVVVARPAVIERLKLIDSTSRHIVTKGFVFVNQLPSA